MEVIIRHMEMSDIDDINDIYQDRAVLENTSLLPYVSAATVKGIFDNTDFYTLVAQYDEKVVGHISLILSSKARQKHASSFAIAVHSGLHGKGVGKALMDAAIEQADNWLNLIRLELEVHADNDAAIAVYKKAGFEVEGEKRFAVFKSGQYISMLMMARINPAYL